MCTIQDDQLTLSRMAQMYPVPLRAFTVLWAISFKHKKTEMEKKKNGGTESVYAFVLLMTNFPLTWN